MIMPLRRRTLLFLVVEYLISYSNENFRPKLLNSSSTKPMTSGV